MKILIPTCREYSEILPLIESIRAVTFPEPEIIVSCLKASASVNRNRCLDHNVELNEIAVMIDDDIRGFYPGWIDDLIYAIPDQDCDHYDPDNSGSCVRCQAHVEFWNTVMVSARLLNPDGTFGPTCARCMESEPMEIELHWDRPHCIMPTAAIAFVNRGFRFDEKFAGSGFEDNDFMKQIAAADPDAKFIQSNRCRLVHLNEAKNQRGENWKHNRDYFFKKWGGRYVA